MARCEVCETTEGIIYTCGYDDQPMLKFCRKHYVAHLAGAHPQNEHAQREARGILRLGIFPEGHPCKWHEGDESLPEQGSEEYTTPGCQGCGSMYSTEDCKGCGREFLDWECKGFDDVIAGPYVTTSGDLYCTRCGPRHDEEEEEEEGDYAFDYDY